jgi:hypothetical protein
MIIVANFALGEIVQTEDNASIAHQIWIRRNKRKQEVNSKRMLTLVSVTTITLMRIKKSPYTQ